jgi:hypothetical protein
VANCVVFVPAVAVGAEGVPVKVGDAKFAFAGGYSDHAEPSQTFAKLVSVS